MFENFLKSWGVLAPLEYTYWLGGRDSLQTYLQRCIHTRRWYYSLQQSEDYVKADVRPTGLRVNQVGKFTECCDEVLLAAYVKALANERAIALNTTWQHFKGDTCKLLCSASWISGAYLDAYKDVVFYGRFEREEESDKAVAVFKDKETWFYVSQYACDQGDRVFYYHNDIGYARKVDSFLGLVDGKYPEQEGLLRFQEVSP